MTKDHKDIQAYLARIRKTVEASKNLVSQVQLRIAETDRMLESQGLTREQVMNMRFSEAQMEAANNELKRRGMDPLERWENNHQTIEPSDHQTIEPSNHQTTPDAEFDNRRLKLSMMMKPFQI